MDPCLNDLAEGLILRMPAYGLAEGQIARIATYLRSLK